MPYLTTPGDTRRAPVAAGEGTGFGVPGWAHPMLAPVEWAALARPEVPLHWAVLDVDHGPGARPDPYCLAAAARLHEAGGRLLGRLDLRRGTRTFGELVQEASRFLDWYRVDGFFLAHCPGDRAYLPELRRTVATLRALCRQEQRAGQAALPGGPPAGPAPADGAGAAEAAEGGGATLVFGHGTHPYPGYAELADQLVTFCGPWAEYRWSQVAEWTADYPPERFCHLVHGVPGPHLEEALRVARWQGAATVFFTDATERAGRNPWAALPGYWDGIVSRLGRGVSE